MKYDNIKKAKFISRPNRFIAEVETDGRIETVHVKNTGRCRELLIRGCDVWLTAPRTPGRKTKYDLVSVRKNNGMIINIDSQAPNKAVYEWLNKQDYNRVIPEYTCGDSRIDFYMEKNGSRYTYLYTYTADGAEYEYTMTRRFPRGEGEHSTQKISYLGFAPSVAYTGGMTGLGMIVAAVGGLGFFIAAGDKNRPRLAAGKSPQWNSYLNKVKSGNKQE